MRGGEEVRRCGSEEVRRLRRCGGAEVRVAEVRRFGVRGDLGVRIAASTFRSSSDIFRLPFDVLSLLPLAPSLSVPLAPPLLLPSAPSTLSSVAIVVLVGECVNSLRGARDGGGCAG